MAARRAEADPPRGRDGTVGAPGAGHQRRLHRAGLHRPVGALVGPVRARHDRRHHPRRQPRPPDPRRAGKHGLPDPRRDRLHGAGRRHLRRRSQGGRRRGHEQLRHAVPGRPARRQGAAAEGGRHDGARRRLPGRAGDRVLAGQGRPAVRLHARPRVRAHRPTGRTRTGSMPAGAAPSTGRATGPNTREPGHDLSARRPADDVLHRRDHREILDHEGLPGLGRSISASMP